ncbi:hypothetical protein DERF_001348 [Dermatophagoides farinae]|uniref:Ig-like domain-containing protein n=1 Tax=Dermatophagoides farinae TaxID=6954 RepID=A0A922I9B0_DERFA|nr:hypothetical protein DERF_001348 [Dermatophagoides farinae]
MVDHTINSGFISKRNDNSNEIWKTGLVHHCYMRPKLAENRRKSFIRPNCIGSARLGSNRQFSNSNWMIYYSRVKNKIFDEIAAYTWAPLLKPEKSHHNGYFLCPYEGCKKNIVASTAIKITWQTNTKINGLCAGLEHIINDGSHTIGTTKIDGNGDGGIRSKTISRIIFHGIEYTDAGKYLCTAFNGAGRVEELSQIIFVHMLILFKFISL